MRRRTLLAAGGLAVLLPGCALPVIPRRPAPTLEDAAGWVLHQEGRYTIRLPRAEMGQNIGDAFLRIACEELGVPPAAVTVVGTSTAAMNRVRATVGSESIRDFAVPLARACATLRLALAQGERGPLLQARELPLAELRSLSGGRRAGPFPQAQGREIVTGAPLYASDVRLPGLVYGRVLRAPVSPEIASRPRQWNEAAARAVPGFVALLQDDRLLLAGSQGLAIVARTPGALDRVEAALAVTWAHDEAADLSPGQQLALDERLARGPLQHAWTAGSPPREGAWTVDLRLEVPLAAHAALEPRAAVARWDGSHLDAWVGSQDVFYVRDVVAKALSLKPAQVRLANLRMGGAFGGRTLCTVEIEAAVLAHRLGQPVKVQWTRAQEFAQGFHRPASSHRVRARVQGGELVAWWHAFATSHILFTNAALPPWLQGISRFTGDAGAARGSRHAYRCRDQRIEHDLVRLQALTGPWRGLGAGPNALAVEAAIDECARQDGVDPVVFRLRHVDDPRLAAVIRRAAALAGREAPAAAGPRRGRGFACGIYKDQSYAAVVAEVEVDAATGAVRVADLWCAVDCGRLIDPDQVAAQTEGNLVWCIGMVLVEALPFGGGAVQARTFAESPIPRLADVGRLHVEAVDSAEPPSGAGETAMVAGAGAIANALKAATGHRFERLPVRPQDVLAALAR